MRNIKEDLEKRYKKTRLEGEIYLWQIWIMEHPEDKETYEDAIGRNIKELKELELKGVM